MQFSSTEKYTLLVGTARPQVLMRAHHVLLKFGIQSKIPVFELQSRRVFTIKMMQVWSSFDQISAVLVYLVLTVNDSAE